MLQCSVPRLIIMITTIGYHDQDNDYHDNHENNDDDNHDNDPPRLLVAVQCVPSDYDYDHVNEFDDDDDDDNDDDVKNSRNLAGRHHSRQV